MGRRGRPSAHGPHLLITSSPDPDAPNRITDKDRVESDARVIVLDAREPNGGFVSTQQAISAIIPPATNTKAGLAPALPEADYDEYYVALPMANETEVNTPGGLGHYIARTRQYGYLHLPDVIAQHARVALVAPGGYGKSIELVNAGRRSEFPALYAKLSGFEATLPGASAELVFVANMRAAQSLSRSCPAPVLTLDQLRTGSYLFALDALDEVARDRANNIAAQIAEVAFKFPQHRWVIATRAVPACELLTGFARWSPFPQLSWLPEYAQLRGVGEDQVKDVLDRSRRLAELVEIPIYGAALVDFTRAGLTLPEQPLEIIWALNDRREEDDEQIYWAPRDQVHVWLNRLALRQQLLATTETSTSALYASHITPDLDHIGISEELLTLLAVRALVTSVGDEVRFPAQLSQEARAGRVLRDAPAGAGLALLNDRVLGTLSVDGFDGSPVTRVRPGWRSLVELLLPLVDEEWWQAIGACDPIMVARATLGVDNAQTRKEAAETIWDHYNGLGITLDSSPSGQARLSDFAVFQKLLADGPSEMLVEKVRDALESDDYTARSNGLLASAFVLDPTAAFERILARITDGNDVVRHYAAQAATSLQFRPQDDAYDPTVLQSALIDQARKEENPDRGATLLTGAAMHMDAEKLLPLTEDLPYPLSKTAADITIDRVDLKEVFAHLRQHTFNSPIGGALLAQLDTFGRQPDLDPTQIATWGCSPERTRTHTAVIPPCAPLPGLSLRRSSPASSPSPPSHGKTTPCTSFSQVWTPTPSAT